MLIRNVEFSAMLMMAREGRDSSKDPEYQALVRMVRQCPADFEYIEKFFQEVESALKERDYKGDSTLQLVLACPWPDCMHIRFRPSASTHEDCVHHFVVTPSAPVTLKFARTKRFTREDSTLFLGNTKKLALASLEAFFP